MSFELRAKSYQLLTENCKLQTNFGGLAQLARASALHAEGQRFESVILHFKKTWRQGDEETLGE